MTDDRIDIGQTGRNLIIKDRDVAFPVISLYVVIVRNITLVLKECLLHVLMFAQRPILRTHNIFSSFRKENVRIA